MSWINKAIALSATTMALLGASAALAETIVVRSTGPSAKAYPPGKSIADNSKVTLKAGDSITILDGRGTRVLKGPGTFGTTSTTAAGSAFSQLLRNTGARQARTGATRSAGTTGNVRSPNVWYVDVSKSGTFCVADTSAATIWRSSAGAAQSLSITRVGDSKTAPLEFRAAQSMRAWPVAEVPIVDGAQYKIWGAGMTNPTTIRIAALGPNLEGLEGTAAALIKKGCDNQLDLIIETVSIPAGETSPTG